MNPLKQDDVKIFTLEMRQALISLAKRYRNDYDDLVKNISKDYWFEGWFISNEDSFTDTCLVCGLTIDIPNTYRHGIQHLKDHNLLPFL